MSDADEANLVLSSRYFDALYYSAEIGIHFDKPEDAAYHFVTSGWESLCRTSDRFDPHYYLETNRDVRDAGLNPLVHFLKFGQKEGRRPAASKYPMAPRPKAPNDEVWERLIKRASPQRTQNKELTAVDVIIPVYRGYDDTLACIYSVLNSTVMTDFRLIVIDDDSPDPKLSQKLTKLADLGLFLLLRNDTNLGFVRTVNRGIILGSSSDIVLVNSDAVVYGDWLDRLRWHTQENERIATVTPYSNNATILSYPTVLEDNNQQLELDYPILDAMFARENSRSSVDIPTGVGFCMYITRACLEEIGCFDERLFGRGYGEENEFCMRASAAGWRNLAALDVFVRHTGAVSFSTNATDQKILNLRRLNVIYPYYDRLIQEFIKVDPLKAGRTRIDSARFAAISQGRGILFIEHGWQGGVGRHVQDLTRLLAEDGIPSLTCTPTHDKLGLSIFAHEEYHLPNLPSFAWTEMADFAATLRALHLGFAHIHSLVGLQPDVQTDFIQGILDANLTYDFTLHDYAPICPRITMIDWGGTYCDTPSTTYCSDCLDRGGTRFGRQDIDLWRHRYREILLRARHIYAPSQDVIDRMAHYFPNRSDIILRPHPQSLAAVSAVVKSIDTNLSDRVVGVIGAIGPHKGSRIIQSLAAECLLRELPLRFVIYGYSDIQNLGDYPNVTITGEYSEDDFDGLIAAIPCDIAFFASIWPETFCYTLDHAVRNRVFPVCFNIGAPAERMRAMKWGAVLPLEYAFSPETLAQALVDLEIDPALPLPEKNRVWLGAERYFCA